MTPNRVNRAHWPTKENTHFFTFVFFGPWTNGQGWPQIGPGRAFFRLIQTLPTLWATWIHGFWFWFWEYSFFYIFCIPHFWISKFPDFQNLAWARLGLGRAWAMWTKTWFSIINIGVWARDRLCRRGETRASVTKYSFFFCRSKWATGSRQPLKAP